MALFRICLFTALNFAALSLQQSKNPITDFCRRWGHQTAQIGQKLYIDGGLVDWNPLSANPSNFTNTYLLYSDLNSSNPISNMPNQYANLTKNATVPSVSGGILWADQVNECFYQFGGEFQNEPQDFSFWTYDTILNQWNHTTPKTPNNNMQRVSYGAGTQIDQLGLGFYYGGYSNSHTIPNWKGPAVATTNLVQYDFTSGTLTNISGPDDTGRAEGNMVYLPASHSGILAYFGGIEDNDRNGTFTSADFSNIHIYDVASSKWYTQKASGNVPTARRQTCAGATWVSDQSSYNIYMYGGYSNDPKNNTAFDEIYILSLPSFTWIKAYNSSATNIGHGGCSANVINHDQMLVIGGYFPNTDACDTPAGMGQHNMVLGYNNAGKSLWDTFDPKQSTYVVPTPVISVVGGSPTGGATDSKPSSWDNGDLSVYFAQAATFTQRAATRAIPTATGSTSGGSSHKSNVGAIAGGVVGGLAFLIAVLLLVLFCLRRRKRAMKVGVEKRLPPVPAGPPVELGTQAPLPPELGGHKGAYVNMTSPQDTQAHANWPGQPPLHRSPSAPYPYPHPYQAPYPPYHDPSTGYPTQPTPYDPLAHPGQTSPHSQHSLPFAGSPPLHGYPPPPTHGSPPPHGMAIPAQYYAPLAEVHGDHLTSPGTALSPGLYEVDGEATAKVKPVEDLSSKHEDRKSRGRFKEADIAT